MSPSFSTVSTRTRVAEAAGMAALLIGNVTAGAATSELTETPGTVPPVLASALMADSPTTSPLSLRTTRVEVTDRGTPLATPLHWSSSAEYSGDQYRWSAVRGALDFGLRFDARRDPGRPFDFRLQGADPGASPLPAITLGLRQFGSGSTLPANTLLERVTGRSETAYVSRVGIEWKPAESNVQFLREGLGLRLDGAQRMTVRLRKGMLGIYMHRKF